VEQVSNLIIEKMITIAESESRYEFYHKQKVFATLLPYAIWQERGGRPEMFRVFLDVGSIKRVPQISWRHALDSLCTALRGATPLTMVLASAHIPWDSDLLEGKEDLVQSWVAMTSAVESTEGIAPECVVGTLFQIAALDELSPHITIDVWLWLTKRPSLPLFSRGYYYGSRRQVVKAVRGLEDIEILKSYMVVVWTERYPVWEDGFDEMCASLREDFGGVGMGHHRVDLIQRLDEIIWQLDQGLEHLRRGNPDLGERDVQSMRDQYGKLMGVLLEGELLEVIARTSCQTIMLLRLLTQVGVRRISRNIYVCAPFVVSIAPFLEPSTSLIPPPPLRPKPDFNPAFHPSHNPPLVKQASSSSSFNL